MFIYNRFFPGTSQILFDAANDDGNGEAIADQIRKGFESLIKKEGGERDAARTLYEENYQHREEIRKLKEEKEELKKNSLSEEQIAEYKELKAVLTENEFEKPEDLKETLKTSVEAKEKLAKLEKEKSNAEIAELMGWNPKVLNRIGGDKEYEIKTRQNADGEDEKYPVVKDGDKEIDLSKYAKDEWSDLLPALKVTENGEAGGEEDKGGKKFTSQNSSSDKKGGGEDDPVAARIARNKKARGLEEEK
jgi:DNA helicase IV